MNDIKVQSLEFDVSNKCGNTCQGCYHNKMISENSISIEKFGQYIEKFFLINSQDSLDSFALYGGNILENKSLRGYLDFLNKSQPPIEQYLFSTTFGEYNILAKQQQKYLLENFFHDKKFIFQYFFNPDFLDSYVQSVRDLLTYRYKTHVFFSVQLISIKSSYIKNTILQLKRFFVSIGYSQKSFLQRLEKSVIHSIVSKSRTENLEIQIGTYTFFIMVLYPIRKEKGVISSVCGDSCSFFSSSSSNKNYTQYSSSMLSIEYNGNMNFHNPNCIASLQNICNIEEDKDVIFQKLIDFRKFLENNISKNQNLIDSCNACLQHNVSKG